jgi:hypothetical protein
MHWQGEWPGRAGVRRQGSSAGFVLDRALSHTQTPRMCALHFYIKLLKMVSNTRCDIILYSV